MLFKTLPASAQRVFSRLGRTQAVQPFYLAGGSATALHLGRRISVDLDFFTTEKYEPAILIPRLQRIGAVIVQQQAIGAFVGLLDKTQVSFFYYPYPLLQPSAVFRGVRVASLLDIALMKITAISQHGRKRDFVDLFFICKSGYALGDLLERVPEKFETLSYPSYHLLRALAYFDDADRDPAPKMPSRLNWTQVKRFFEKHVDELMRKL